MEKKIEDNIWFHCSNSSVRRAARQLRQLYGDAMGMTDLRGTQFSLLSQIRHLKEPTQKELAQVMIMDLSALGHTLKLLIRDGLVELVPDEKDRRARRVRLTPAGEQRQDELVAAWQNAQRRFDKVFGAERSEEFRRALAFIASDEFAAAYAAADEGEEDQTH
ncbi:MarR family winged helix-turn-helix transcriptional regulator [Neorhizobium sp. NCHU2750]|uniref:MarR family winged helix-turn-helix transcriptional regulator n=1 Tax=Neorhizobium sp. NCHU2750 TaxID=1825976 RepID=UPI000E73DC53|nr:MarR family transcriptional regulator [Neorhizobium sp. NCHU2750]